MEQLADYNMLPVVEVVGTDYQLEVAVGYMEEDLDPFVNMARVSMVEMDRGIELGLDLVGHNTGELVGSNFDL